MYIPAFSAPTAAYVQKRTVRMCVTNPLYAWYQYTTRQHTPPNIRTDDSSGVLVRPEIEPSIERRRIQSCTLYLMPAACCGYGRVQACTSVYTCRTIGGQYADKSTQHKDRRRAGTQKTWLRRCDRTSSKKKIIPN